MEISPPPPEKELSEEKLSPGTPNGGGSDENSHHRLVDRSASPGGRTLGRRSVGAASGFFSPNATSASGFSFGKKTLGIWDHPAQIVLRNNVILHNTRVNIRADADAPGPGTYNLRRRPGADGKVYSMRIKLPAGTFDLPKTPAVTDYNPEKKLLSPVRRAPAYSFGLKKNQRNDNGVPGPGAYSPPRRLQNPQAVTISFGPKCGRSAIEPFLASPGPAAHTPGTFTPVSTGFSFGLKTENSVKSVLKGEPSVLLMDTAELAAQLKSKTIRAGMVTSPGPGMYIQEHHTSSINGPKYSMSLRTTDERREFHMPHNRGVRRNSSMPPPEVVPSKTPRNRTDGWVLPRLGVNEAAHTAAYSGPPSPVSARIPVGPHPTTMPMAHTAQPHVVLRPQDTFGVPQPAPQKPRPPRPESARTSHVGFPEGMAMPYGKFPSSDPYSGRPQSGMTRSDSGVARPVSGITRPESGRVERPESGVSRPQSGINRPESGRLERPESGIHRPVSGVRSSLSIARVAE